MRRLLIVLTFFAVCFARDVSAAAYPVGGRWLIEGNGFAERGFLRVSLWTQGTVAIKSQTSEGTEYLTGYDVWGELNASRLGINTWGYQGKYEPPNPISVGEFEPTLNEPFRIPTFSIGKLNYTITLTDVNSGVVNISGFVDIDVVGETEINADCAIWREGTLKPQIPDSGSGCDAGAGSLALLLSFGAVFIGRRHP
jgi:hypothetical protein